MLCILTCANQLKEDKAKWANSRGVPTNRPGGTLQGAPSRDTAGDQQAAFLTERARCLLCSRPDVFFFFFFLLSESQSLGSPCPLGRGGQRRVARDMELCDTPQRAGETGQRRGGEGLTMSVPSSSERRCCRSNQRVYNKTQQCL